jgi:2'-5' RNA ligase
MPKRLFIAADISDEARSLAANLIADLRKAFPTEGISWVKPENLHITIKFLGDTDEANEAKLIAMLGRVTSSYAPFKLHLAEPEVLGKRVMSIGVKSDSATVFSLEMVIDTECERLGFRREGRRLHPHLTLARIRDPKAAAPIVQEFRQVQITPVEFKVENLALYESRLTPGGSIYSIARKFELLQTQFGVPPLGGLRCP